MQKMDSIKLALTKSVVILNHDQNVVRLLEWAKQVHLKLNKNKASTSRS